MPLARALLTTLVAAVAVGAPAQAATRYTAPGATGPEPCAAASPCAIADAVGNAADGDSVVVRTGSYGSPGLRLTAPIAADSRVDIAGEAGQPKPVLYMNAPNAVRLDHADATLRWLEINSAGGGAALSMAGRLAEQVVVHSSAAGGVACSAQSGTIRNSVCRTTGTNAPAVGFAGAGLCGDAQPSPDSVLRGVTAWASGSNSNGLSVQASCSVQKRIVAVNTVARGSARDVFTQTDANPNTRARVETDHANFATRTTDGPNATIADSATQTAVPAFANAAGGDFRQASNSPTIDAGIAGDDNGGADFEGTTRAIVTTDIGADEFERPPSATTGESTAVEIDTATVTGSVTPWSLATTYRFEYGPTATYGQTTEPVDAGSGVDPVAVAANLTGLSPATTYHYRVVAMSPAGSTAGVDQVFVTKPQPPPPAPQVTGLAFAPRTFAIGSKAPTLLAARAKRPPVGTTIRFTLNQPATVKLTFFRVESGRRVGKKCRPLSRANGKRPRCTRTVAVRRTLSFAGRAGLNQIRFQGRLTARERLGFGAHEVAVVATDELSRSSSPARAAFRIARR